MNYNRKNTQIINIDCMNDDFKLNRIINSTNVSVRSNKNDGSTNSVRLCKEKIQCL